MEWKIIIPIIFIIAVLISGCADTEEKVEEEQEEVVEEVEEVIEEPEEIIEEENCAELDPGARIECCQKKGYDNWDGEKCIMSTDKSTTANLKSEGYEDNVLEVYIDNIGNNPISLSSSSITMTVRDAYAKVVCSGKLNSETVRCYSGCGGELEGKDTQGLEVDLSNCGNLGEGDVYFYTLEFEGGAMISGSFTG